MKFKGRYFRIQRHGQIFNGADEVKGNNKREFFPEGGNTIPCHEVEAIIGRINRT